MNAMSKAPEDPPPDDAIPPVLQLAWGLRDVGTRGPKRGLTLNQIVAAGIKVAHTDGVGAMSMASIAAELGVGTMSLYRYISAKDELLLLMVDAALGAPPPAKPDEDWRAGLRRWALGVWQAYLSQPWALRVPISGPPYGPNNVAWLENALVALAETPLAEQDKLSAVLLVSGFVRNVATLTADFQAGAAGEAVMPGYGEMLTRLTKAQQFPALHRAIASGVLDDDDDIEIELEFGLERILDGLAVLIDQARSRAQAPR
jgi:AcrR family transcriptional regulator